MHAHSACACSCGECKVCRQKLHEGRQWADCHCTAHAAGHMSRQRSEDQRCQKKPRQQLRMMSSPALLTRRQASTRRQPLPNQLSLAPCRLPTKLPQCSTPRVLLPLLSVLRWALLEGTALELSPFLCLPQTAQLPQDPPLATALLQAYKRAVAAARKRAQAAAAACLKNSSNFLRQAIHHHK